MATCKPYVEFVDLYRGQTKDYGAILSHSWRKFYLAEKKYLKDFEGLIENYISDNISAQKLRERLKKLRELTDGTYSLFAFVLHGCNIENLLSFLDYAKSSFSPKFHSIASNYALVQLRQLLFGEYQHYIFNQIWSSFFESRIDYTLYEMSQFVLDFYNQNRRKFNVRLRIGSVAMDIMGILQHYGVIGTPGIDLTGDLDVAIWFATHEYIHSGSNAGSYRKIDDPDQWGFIYHFKSPTVFYSTLDLSRRSIDVPPSPRSISLNSISPLFTRIVHQQGWYGALESPWMHYVDFSKYFECKKQKVTEFGEPAFIIDRLVSRGITQEYLFPSEKDDPFKGFLAKKGVSTFL
jgi:hypothetical protein